jgi:hypothetical protein
MLRISQFPYKTSVLTILLCYLVIEKPPGGPLRLGFDSKAECYPFSSFPMYAEFADAPIITFYTDDQDQPIAIKEMTSAGASASKKDYYGLLKQAIVQLKKDHPKDYPGLKIAEAPTSLKQAVGKSALRDFLTIRALTWGKKHPQKVIRLYEGVITKAGVTPRQTLLAEGSYQTVTAATP